MALVHGALDGSGAPLSAPRDVSVDRAQVEAAARTLVGEQMQVPPAYSAKRSGGERLYDLARRPWPDVTVVASARDRYPRVDCRLRLDCGHGSRFGAGVLRWRGPAPH